MRKYWILAFTALVIIASCSKKGTPTAKKEKAINPATVFANNCAGCHGADGTTGRAPNLSKVTRDKGGIVAIITKGEGHMPAFEDRLSQREIDAVADFVVSLKK